MIIIDIEKCEGCGDCAALCPNDCLVIYDMIVYPMEECCVECGVCESVCPNEAITLIET